MEKRRIFKDPQVQERFENDGFVKLQLLGKNEVEQIQALYNNEFGEDVQAFFSSSYLDDFDRKTRISDAVTKILSERIADTFEECRLLGAAFLVKGTDKHSEMPMHQDWTIVDESKFYAVNIWIPLTDTTEHNGTIEVMKGSHRVNHALRAPTLPFFFEGYEERIKEKLTPVSAKLGEVVVLNQAVIHYSKPNLSEKIRPAVTVGLTSKDAQLVFHYWDQKTPGKVELFEQEDDFLLRFENFHEAIYERPTVGVSKGHVDYDFPVMDDATLERIIGPTKKLGFFARIFSS